MVNQQLLDYIKTEEAQGYTPKQLRDYLIQQGYDPNEVDEAINIVNTEMQSAPQTSAPQQVSTQPTGQSTGIKRRKPLLVLLFSLITFGIYFIYWVVSTTNELRKNTKSAPNPLLLLLLLVPLVNIVVTVIYYWKYSKAINELTGFDKVGLFILFMLFSPAAMIVSQVQLNKKAG